MKVIKGWQNYDFLKTFWHFVCFSADQSHKNRQFRYISNKLSGNLTEVTEPFLSTVWPHPFANITLRVFLKRYFHLSHNIFCLSGLSAKKERQKLNLPLGEERTCWEASIVYCKMGWRVKENKELHINLSMFKVHISC